MNNETECSLSTKISNEKIICSVSTLDFQIAIELEEPWASNPIKSPNFLAALQNLLPNLVKSKLKYGLNYFSKSIYSIKNHTKIFIFSKNKNEFDPFIKKEISFPNDDLIHLGALILNYLSGDKETFKKWEIFDYNHVNEIFVCIHGERDSCCGKYGINIYHEFLTQINNSHKNFRVWKSTHIGGHRYAPTFYEAPSMRWYGLFQKEDIPFFLDRKSNQFTIKNNYRGMSGISNKYALLAENELFKKYSWKWHLASEKYYEVILKGENELTEVNFFFKFHHEFKLTKQSYKIQLSEVIEGKTSCGSFDIKMVKQYLVLEI